MTEEKAGYTVEEVTSFDYHMSQLRSLGGHLGEVRRQIKALEAQERDYEKKIKTIHDTVSRQLKEAAGELSEDHTSSS